MSIFDHFISKLQTSSLTPFVFLNSCCREDLFLQLNLMQTYKKGIQSLCSHPELSDLLIVAGPITQKQLGELESIYQKMLHPKWVLAIGTCCLTGAGFETEVVVKNISEKIPVDIYVPGCPCSPYELENAFSRLQELIKKGRGKK